MNTILQSLGLQAQNRPEAIAIQGSSKSLTWQEVEHGVTSTARYLQPYKTLGLHLNNSPAWVIIDLATINSGACHVPLPTFFSHKQLQHAVKDAGIELIITDQPEWFDFLKIKHQEVINIAGQELACIITNQECPLANDFNIAKITYTSGTTGTPRGVMLTLGHIEAVAHSLHQASKASAFDRALALIPLSTLLENIGAIYVPILAGATMIIPDAGETGLSGSSKILTEKFASALTRYRPTTIVVPPQLLKLMIALAKNKLLPDSFRYIAVGGAPCSIHLLNQASQLGLPVYQGYGLSEACSVVSVNTPDAERIGSAGKPLPHCSVHISDGGEIMIRGTLYRGYLNQAQEHEQELATGDIGYLDDDGYLFITGRRKDTIITSYGRNIAPEWVESELLSHPKIAQAAIFNSDADQLTAVIVPSEGRSVDRPGQQVNRAVKEVNMRLPDYARIQKILIANSPFSIQQGELTSNGRPRRDVIRQRYTEQPPERYGDQA